MGNARGVKRDFLGLERRRMRAARLFGEGLGQAEVGRRVGVVRQTASRWYWEWKSGGARRLKGAGRAGRKCRLNEEQRRAVVCALEAGATVQGYVSELWTTARVAKLIEKLTGIAYHPDHVGRLLSQLGWSCQRPERKARERNEQKIVQWRKQDWPRIKKKPGKRGEQ